MTIDPETAMVALAFVAVLVTSAYHVGWHVGFTAGIGIREEQEWTTKHRS